MRPSKSVICNPYETEISSSTASSYFLLGLPLLRLPPGLASNTRRTVDVSGIPIMWFSHLIRCALTNLLILCPLTTSFSSWLYLERYSPIFTWTGPNIFRSIFLSKYSIWLIVCNVWSNHQFSFRKFHRIQYLNNVTIYP